MTTSFQAVSDPLIAGTDEFYLDPYPTFRLLREKAPVFWSEKGNYWLVSRYAEAHEILGDLHFEKSLRQWKQADLFAKLIPSGCPLSSFRTPSVLSSNPPQHTRLRSLMNKAFTPTMVSQMRERIKLIANELLDHVQKKGEIDLMADFAFQLPAIVIAEMLGVPAKDRSKFKSWSHALTAVTTPVPNPFAFPKVVMGYRELVNYLQPLIDERRKNRKNDLISALVTAEEEGSHLTENEILANAVILLVAGHETTTNLIGNGTLALLRHPDQLAELQEKSDLLPVAVQELLRYDSPAQFVRRVAAQDVELGRQKIANGQVVFILLGAANHDPAEFENPDELDIKRAKNKHLAFGHGIHHCLGSALASAEGEIALGTLLARMPRLKLKKQRLEYNRPFALRGLKHLYVNF